MGNSFSENAGIDMEQPRISIIMRSHNDAALIDDTLRMIFSQTVKDFEILNVDSSSTDGTLEIIKRYNPDNIIQNKPEDYNPGRVLNDAISRVSGEWLVFCNSDCTPQSEDWLEKLVAPLACENVAATFSRQVERPDADAMVRLMYDRTFGAKRARGLQSFFFSLASAAIRRSVWEKRPFYTDANYSEDVEWAYRAGNAGHDIVYVPESVAMHSHNYTLKQLHRRHVGEGEADVFIFGARPSAWGQFMRWLKFLVTDTAWFLKHGRIGWIFYGPIYRAVMCRAYYRGNKTGVEKKRRLEIKSQDRESYSS